MYQSRRFVVSFEIENMSPPSLFFFFKTNLILLDQFYFYMNFRISLSLFAKKPDGSLIQIALNLWIGFMYVFLTILRFPICGSGIYFHLFKSSLVSHQCFAVFSTLSLSVIHYSFQMLLQRTLFSSVDLHIVHSPCIETQLISI